MHSGLPQYKRLMSLNLSGTNPAEPSSRLPSYTTVGQLTIYWSNSVSIKNFGNFTKKTLKLAATKKYDQIFSDS